MKLPWKREPRDLVAEAIAENERANAEVMAWRGVTWMPEELDASGGWCAPSEVIYDLPDITVRRGGIRHP